MRKFKEAKPTDLRAKAFTGVSDYLSQIDRLSYADVEIKNLAINTELSDFGAGTNNHF